MENEVIHIGEFGLKYPKHKRLPSDPYQRYPGFNRRIDKKDVIENIYCNKLSDEEKECIKKVYKNFEDKEHMITDENITDKIKLEMQETCIRLNKNAEVNNRGNRLSIAKYKTKYYIMEHTCKRRRLYSIFIPLYIDGSVILSDSSLVF